MQAEVLQPEAGGRDLIAFAQTGSDKTIAFGLAMAQELLGDSETIPFSERPLALIIAPTRELAWQVSCDMGWIYGNAGGRIAT